MRIRDYFGFPLLAIGITGVMLGHHWFGLILFLGGVLLTALGLTIIASGAVQAKIEKALRSYRGPGDYGSTAYHGGRSLGEQDQSVGDSDGD